MEEKEYNRTKEKREPGKWVTMMLVEVGVGVTLLYPMKAIKTISVYQVLTEKRMW